MNELSGKAIIITGAGSGLGEAYARHAASLGAAILVNDISAKAAERVADAINGTGGRAQAHAADVALWQTGTELTQACEAAFGRVSGLVNNAGILQVARLEEMDEPLLARLLQVNLIGTAACTQAAIAAFRRAGTAGSVVNVASGSHAGDVALGAYAASKGAIASLTYAWAMELRGSGIRLNAISPLAETDMARTNAHMMATQSAAREVAYKTLPDPAVNAPVVSYLLSDHAQAIHGQIIRIAGRELSFVTHPMIARPVLEGVWTYERICEAFAGPLAEAQQKLGLTYAPPHMT